MVLLLLKLVHCRVFPVTRNVASQQGFHLSQDATDDFDQSLANDAPAAVGHRTTLEVCYDIKEAWNIFEV